MPIVGEDGEPEFIQGYFVDITERKQLEQHLITPRRPRRSGARRRDRPRLQQPPDGDPAATPSSLSARSGETRPPGATIREISAAVERAAKLTRQLLAFSRRQELEPQIV